MDSICPAMGYMSFPQVHADRSTPTKNRYEVSLEPMDSSAPKNKCWADLASDISENEE